MASNSTFFLSFVQELEPVCNWNDHSPPFGPRPIHLLHIGHFRDTEPFSCQQYALPSIWDLDGETGGWEGFGVVAVPSGVVAERDT